MTRGHSVDEYLEAIYSLSSPIGEVTRHAGQGVIAARVAETLGVSRASAGEMVKRLIDLGLVERDGRRLTLTATGWERAENVVRNHRILELFLTDFLGYTAAESHEHADQIGQMFTDDMITRIHERLGEPERCPHGWPVAPEQEREENDVLRRLVELAPGTSGEIVRLGELDGDLLAWFYEHGFVPGVHFEVEEVNAAAGHLQIELGGERRVIADKAASSVLVRPVA